MSAIGILLQLAYRLRRHFIAGWSVARWLGTSLVVGGVVLLAVRWSVTWDVILVAAVFLMYVVILWWAGRVGYLYFRASPAAETLLTRVPDAAPLQPEERVPVQAAGPFTVQGQNQYYVNLDAEYETVRSGEHIVLARVFPSRFLWLGSWPDYELGYWYLFFQPAMLRRIRVGHLFFGPRPQLAIEVAYSPDDENRHEVYLASEAAGLRRIWDDLVDDAPSGVSAPATGEENFL